MAYAGSLVYNDKVLIGGARDKWRCGFSNQQEVDQSFVTNLTSRDKFRFEGNAFGSRFAALTRSSLNSTSVSSMKGLSSFSPPTRIGFGLSLSQRISGEVFVVDAVAIDDNGNVIGGEGGEFGPEYDLEFASSTTTQVIFKTVVDADFLLDDFVCLYGHVDSRLDQFGKITDIIDSRTFAITAEMTITTSTGSGGSGKVRKINIAGNAEDGFGIIMSGTTSANVYTYTKSEGSPALYSSYLSLGSSYSDAAVAVAKPYVSCKQPRYNTEMIMAMDMVKWVTTPSDNQGDLSVVLKRTQNIPSIDKRYVMRIRAIALPNAKPAIKILNVTKSGTTTATVTTVEDHNLVTNNFVRIFGINESTVWPNLVVDTIITVTGPRTFTLTWGTAVTSTYYGGIVKPAHAGMAYGIQSGNVKGWSWRDGKIWVATVSTPTLSVGDTVRILGVADSSGNRGIDGLYRVLVTAPTVSASDAVMVSGSANITVRDSSKYSVGMVVNGANFPANSTVVSIVDATHIVISANATVSATSGSIVAVGVVLEPIDVVNEAGGVTGSIVAGFGGGVIIRETDIGLHFMRSLDHTRTPVEIVSGHQSADIAMSVPVAVNTIRSGTVTANEGTFSAQSTYSLNSAAGTNATAVKTTAGTVYAMAVTNYGATNAFVKLYNKASAPTVGTDVPRFTINIAPNESKMIEFGRAGVRYTAGIGASITGAQAIADTTAVAANQVIVDLSYA